MSWYYAVNGQQAGPVEYAELQRLAMAGAVNASTLVWRAGMDAWAAFGTLLAPAPVAVEPCLQCRRNFAAEQPGRTTHGPRANTAEWINGTISFA